MFGAILSLSFSLFAYVYILARASFLYQSQYLIDLSKNLGFSKIRSFLQVILPSARPAIVAGLSLVAMETLAEFGAVDFFSINTLTSGIYNSTTLLLGVLILTFIFGTGTAYLVSFYVFPGSNFFKWALILSFAVPPYIYAYSIFAFFDNYGTAFTILKNLFGEGEYNTHIPKFS